VQRVPAGRLPVSILPLDPRPDFRSCHAAPVRRGGHLGECGCRLLALQSRQGWPAAVGGQDVALAEALSPYRSGPAEERASLSAELSARKLDRLSLLGRRTGALTAKCSRKCDGSKDQAGNDIPAGK